jgi:hypothetical protein
LARREQFIGPRHGGLAVFHVAYFLRVAAGIATRPGLEDGEDGITRSSRFAPASFLWS